MEDKKKTYHWGTGRRKTAVARVRIREGTGQFLVNPRSDQFIAGYAFREFAASSLRAGEGFPLWNPYLFGGMPYVAAMHGDIFYPTFLLRMIFPTDVAMTCEYVVRVRDDDDRLLHNDADTLYQTSPTLFQPAAM